MWSGGPLRYRAAGRRLLEPARRYRSRCDWPGESYASRHGAGVSARGPTYVPQSLAKPAYMFLE